MQAITPFLWFNGQAEEAMNFYVSIFNNSKVIGVNRMPDGQVMGGTFQLDGLEFYALNGGPMYSFTPAVSFFVNCETQEEVDRLWARLTEGGEESRCGWLKDKFGLSWQIIPSVLGKMLSDNVAGDSRKAMEAMLGMKKLDIAGLERAYRR